MKLKKGDIIYTNEAVGRESLHEHKCKILSIIDNSIFVRVICDEKECCTSGLEFTIFHGVNSMENIKPYGYTKYILTDIQFEEEERNTELIADKVFKKIKKYLK